LQCHSLVCGGVVKFGNLKGGTEIPRCRKFILKNLLGEKKTAEMGTLHNKSFLFYPEPVLFPEHTAGNMMVQNKNPLMNPPLQLQ